MVGRNDPCPCGSGKKYKRCCLSKDRAARTQSVAAKGNQDFFEEIVPERIETDPVLNFNPPNDVLPMPEIEEIDPLLARINVFWEAFMDAPYEKQWALVTELLAEEPELCDGEMVFEIANTLFDQAVDANEIERYKNMLDQLEEIVPDAYAEELHYILDWRIQIAIIEGDDTNTARYFHEYSPLAGEHLDIYYRMMSALAYHEKLSILYEGMQQARPYVEDGAGLVEWAYGEFSEKLGDIEVLHLLDETSNLQVDDPILQQHFSEYDLSIILEIFSVALDYQSGRQMPAWTLADFHFTKRTEKDPSRDNFNFLLAAFTYYAHQEEGISRIKTELARNELASYITLRFEGELGSSKQNRHKRKKRSRKVQFEPKVSQHPLCPDVKTLDRFLAQLIGFMSFRYYEAFALFELIPAWLRFLAKYNLLEEDTRLQIIKELSSLKNQLALYAENQMTDTVMARNLADWPYEPEES